MEFAAGTCAEYSLLWLPIPGLRAVPPSRPLGAGGVCPPPPPSPPQADPPVGCQQPHLTPTGGFLIIVFSHLVQLIRPSIPKNRNLKQRGCKKGSKKFETLTTESRSYLQTASPASQPLGPHSGAQNPASSTHQSPFPSPPFPPKPREFFCVQIGKNPRVPFYENFEEIHLKIFHCELIIDKIFPILNSFGLQCSPKRPLRIILRSELKLFSFLVQIK